MAEKRPKLIIGEAHKSAAGVHPSGIVLTPAKRTKEEEERLARQRSEAAKADKATRLSGGSASGTGDRRAPRRHSSR